MNINKTVFLFLVLLCKSILLFAQQNSPTNNLGIETKMSESYKNGKYKRITKVFEDKMLVSIKEETSVRGSNVVDFVFIKLFRDGEMIFNSTRDVAKNTTIRSYYNHGKMVLEEGNEGADSSRETMIFFDANEQPFEAFDKNLDGVVKQVSAERLSNYKKSFLIIKN